MGMIIGTVTFSQDPAGMTLIREDRINSFVKTYSNVAFFSWGSSIIGKEISLFWNSMTIAQFEDIMDLFIADIPYVFTPNDGEGHTYDVEITSFTGEYCKGVHTTGIRKNIELKLLIMGVD